MKVMFDLEAGTNVIPNIYRKQEGRPGAEVNSGRRKSMHARLAETMDYVEEKRRELLQSFAGVARDRLSRRASAGGWSVAEILDHLRMVESGVARLITKRATRAREEGLGEETSAESVLTSLEPYRAEFENTVMQAPETVRPRSNPDPDEALIGLHSSREALREAAEAASGLALSEIKQDHPLLGELDLYQWLIFLGQHEVRHKKQIERTLNSIPK
jgi:hypothetical protein